jgi:hypothetical protein
MSGLFKPKMPKIEMPPPAPTTDEAKVREIESKRLRMRRGRAASMMTTPESRAAGGVGTTRLLGGG